LSAISQDTSLERIAASVCSVLERHGVRVVLSGGSVVTIYSENEYESYDLDFVPTGLVRRVDDAMAELGFRKQGRHWVHPASRFWVEFPAGPVQVGDTLVTEFAERETPDGVLRLLRPTECVMDRLAGFYHWNDPQCLDQAVAVASRHVVDMAAIEAWSQRERAAERFAEFFGRLQQARARRPGG